jgi:hypothetical protein
MSQFNSTLFFVFQTFVSCAPTFASIQTEPPPPSVSLFPQTAACVLKSDEKLSIDQQVIVIPDHIAIARGRHNFRHKFESRIATRFLIRFQRCINRCIDK